MPAHGFFTQRFTDDVTWSHDTAAAAYTVKAVSLNRSSPRQHLYPLLGRTFMLLGSFTDSLKVYNRLRKLGAQFQSDSTGQPLNRDVIVAAGHDAALDPRYQAAQRAGCSLVDEDAVSSILLKPDILSEALMPMPAATTGIQRRPLTPTGSVSSFPCPSSTHPVHAQISPAQQPSGSTPAADTMPQQQDILPSLPGNQLSFSLLGHTNEQQALGLVSRGASVFQPSTARACYPLSRDTIIIAGPQATADPAQTAGCKMLYSDGLAAALLHPSHLPNFLGTLPGTPPDVLPSTQTSLGAVGLGLIAPIDLAQHQQQNASLIHDNLADSIIQSGHQQKVPDDLAHPVPDQQHDVDDSLAPIPCNIACPAKTFATMQQQQRAQANTCSQLLAGYTFLLLMTSSIVTHKDELFRVQHWQQQLEQLGAVVVLQEPCSTAPLDDGSAGFDVNESIGIIASCVEPVVIVSDGSTAASDSLAAARQLGCSVFDVEELIAMLEDPGAFLNHEDRILVSAAAPQDPATAAAGPLSHHNKMSYSMTDQLPCLAQHTPTSPAEDSGAIHSDLLQQQQHGNRHQNPRTSNPQAQQQQPGPMTAVPRPQQPQAEGWQEQRNDRPLTGCTFMFVGAFKKRNSVISKLQRLGALMVWTPDQDRFGPDVIVVAGGAAARYPQYAAAYVLRCKMLRRKWLKDVLAEPERLGELLEDMAVPAWTMGGQQQQQPEQQGLGGGQAGFTDGEGVIAAAVEACRRRKAAKKAKKAAARALQWQQQQPNVQYVGPPSDLAADLAAIGTANLCALPPGVATTVSSSDRPTAALDRAVVAAKTATAAAFHIGPRLSFSEQQQQGKGDPKEVAENAAVPVFDGASSLPQQKEDHTAVKKSKKRKQKRRKAKRNKRGKHAPEPAQQDTAASKVHHPQQSALVQAETVAADECVSAFAESEWVPWAQKYLAVYCTQDSGAE